MRLALEHARRSDGITGSNPAVGCVITDRQGGVVVAASTAPGGRPHAEELAATILHQQFQTGTVSDAVLDTAYVTLEPCAHARKPRPCAETLVQLKQRFGLRRVIIGVGDPDRRVDGRGVAMLRAAGLQVEMFASSEYPSLAAAIARHHHAYVKCTRELGLGVTVKVACDPLGNIARCAADGMPVRTALTGRIAQAYVHGLRRQHGGILVGARTWDIDRPRLNVRLRGLEADAPTVFVAGHGERDIRQTLDRIGQAAPIHSVLIEGGARLIAAAFEAQVIDRMIVLRAPKPIEGAGYRCDFARMGIDVATMTVDPQRWKVISRAPLGDDMMMELDTSAPSPPVSLAHQCP